MKATDPDTPPLDRIQSHTPATTWECAMLSGNGTLGALVFGEPLNETVVVNHERLFRPRRTPGDPLNVAPHLNTLRTIINREGYASGLVFLDTVAAEKEMRAAEGLPSFHPAFEVAIRTRVRGAVRDYVRETDFRTGEVSVRFRDEAAAHRRGLFVSRASGDIVMELRCEEPGGLDCELELIAPAHPDVEPHLSTGAAGACLSVSYLYGSGGYDGALRLAADAGEVTVSGGSIRVSGAQTVCLRLRVAPWTSRQRADAQALLDRLGICSESYRESLAAHVALHGALYDRVSLDLGGADADRRCAIDALLAQAQQTGAMPLALLEKVYRAGRYMSLCCCGQLPPNLQGVWTGTWECPWASTYVWDTNYQLAIASVMSGNLAELQQAHINLIELVLPFWRDNARRIGAGRGLFASGAFAAGINADGAEKHTYGHWSWMFGAGYAGWMARISYEHWLYTGDRETLKRHTLPLLIELAQFYEAWLVSDADGRLRFTPACSPELAFGDNPTFEIAVARDVFAMLADGAAALDDAEREALGLTAAQADGWKALVARLPEYRVNDASTTAGPPDTRPYYIDKAKVPLAADGALKEFADANVPEGYPHRHYSHLYPLFVSGAFDPEGTPELWRAAEIAFLKKMAYPFNATHARMHAALCAARLGCGETVWGILTGLAAADLFFPNLMISHVADRRILNVDGNGAIPEIIHRLLVYARPGAITFLPAVPAALGAGCIRGVRLVRQITLCALRWDLAAGTLQAEVVSAIDQIVTVGIGGGREGRVLHVEHAGAVTQPEAGGGRLLRIALVSQKACIFEISFVSR